MYNDLRFALRQLRKSPGFTAVAVLTLALGIGANTAIFSVVNAVLLLPLPYKDPDRLVLVSQNFSGKGLIRTTVSAAEFIDYRERGETFDQVAAFRYQAFNLSAEGQSERIPGTVCSAGLSSLLGVQPAWGRTFLSEEDQPGRNQVVVLSHGLWQRRFGSDPNLIEKAITLNGATVTVIGIMPQGFLFPSGTEIWMPIAFTDDLLRQREGPRNLRVIARLRSGVSIKQAQARMDHLASEFQQQHPEVYLKDSGWSISLVSLRDQLTGSFRTALLLLLGVVATVLLIACANVANLLLARATTREREIAIRTALGASRSRILGQLLTESFLLSFLGGVFGLLLALWGVDVLTGLYPGVIPNSQGIGVEEWVSRSHWPFRC